MRLAYWVAIIFIGSVILLAQLDCNSHSSHIYIHTFKSRITFSSHPAHLNPSIPLPAIRSVVGGRKSYSAKGCDETGLQRLANWIARYQRFAWDRSGVLISYDNIYSIASRDHNPGKLQEQGYNKDKHGYSIFPSAAVGWRKLDEYLLNYITHFGHKSLRFFMDGNGRTWRGYYPADAFDPQHSFSRFLALSMEMPENASMIEIARLCSNIGGHQKPATHNHLKSQ